MQILEDTDIFPSCSEAWRRRRSSEDLHRRKLNIRHQASADMVNNEETGRQDMKYDDFRAIMDSKTTDLQLVLLHQLYCQVNYTSALNK